MDLGEYLKLQATRPWAWGFADCTTFAADWVKSVTGIDPMAKWRGYKTDIEVELLIAEAGGLLALWGEGMIDIWPRVSGDPAIGNIGLITVQGQDGEPIDIGAIFSGKRWCFRSPPGIGGASIDPANLVASWGR